MMWRKIDEMIITTDSFSTNPSSGLSSMYSCSSLLVPWWWLRRQRGGKRLPRGVRTFLTKQCMRQKDWLSGRRWGGDHLHSYHQPRPKMSTLFSTTHSLALDWGSCVNLFPPLFSTTKNLVRVIYIRARLIYWIWLTFSFIRLRFFI